MKRSPPDGEARALLILQRLSGIGDRNLASLVDRFGSATAALEAPARAFGPDEEKVAIGRADPLLARRVDEGLAWCAAHGVRVVHRWAKGYPEPLRPVENPPGVLFLKGDAGLLESEIVTIVGSRRSTEYGRRVAREVAGASVRAGAVVASGLAIGIDGEAHRAALAAGGRTLAVLGAGLARPYPRRHVELFRRIAREGLLVSEFLPHEPAFKQNFPRRNRTLAALARVVVVVEAAERSGALNTGRHALDLGKVVLSAPGSIYAPNSRGTNELLNEAYPLVTPGTVLEHLAGGAAEPLSLFPLDPPAEVGPDALRIWAALAESARHVDELARDARLAPAATLAALSLLEVGGWIRQEPGARFARGAV